jgi:hypothetical protein
VPPSPVPAPQQPARSVPAEVATAKAELEIVLLPTKKEVRTRANGAIAVPGDQSKRLIEAMDRLCHLAVGAILVIGTLFGASSAHLNPASTITLIVLELIFISVLALVRRSSRRK